MIRVLYFSPTGGTKKVAEALGKGFDQEVQLFNILSEDPMPYEYQKGDSFVLVAPVFAGRIPAVVKERLENQKGNGRPAAVVAVYGNRAFDDALIEMADWMKELGFVTVAGVGAIAQHSLSPALAAGRPDRKDCQELKKFGEKLQCIFKEEVWKELGDKLPGNRPYRVVNPSPVCTDKTDACKKCGLCVKVCPTKAISLESLQVHNPEQCIMCKACVVACPEGARYLPEEFEKNIQQHLSPCEKVRRENELFTA